MKCIFKTITIQKYIFMPLKAHDYTNLYRQKDL